MKLLDEYLRKMLRKGAPTAFVSVKGLYKDTNKVKTIEKMLLGFLQCLETHGTFVESGKLSGKND